MHAGVNQRFQPLQPQQVKLFCWDDLVPWVTSEGIRLQAASLGCSELCRQRQTGRAPAAGCPFLPTLGVQQEGILVFWSSCSGSTQGKGKNCWSPALSWVSVAGEAHSPAWEGRARWVSEKGDTSHTAAWDRYRLMCHILYNKSESIQSDTLPPAPAARPLLQGLLTCTFTGLFFFFHQTPKYIKHEAKFEQVEGLCTAPLKGDSNF